MKRIFTIFFNSRETSSIVVTLCLLFAGIAEAGSIGTLLPAIKAISGSSSESTSQFSGAIRNAFESVGIATTVGNLILLVVFFMLTKAVLLFAALSYTGVSAARVSIMLRRRLIAAIFDARWAFFVEQRGGRIANAISNDAGRAGDAYLLAAQVVALVIQGLAYAAVALFIDWRLALLGIAGGGIVALTTKKLIRISRSAGYKQTDRTAALTMLMIDMLTNVKPLKAMQRHQAALAAMAQTLKRLKNTLITRELARAGLMQSSDAVVILLVGGGAYFANQILQTPLPELVVSGVVFFQLLSITSKLQKYAQQSVQLESAYVRTQELIGHAETSREVNDGTTKPVIEKGCQFHHVHFSHGKTAVVSDVTFDIPARAITVLNGPSGAGKTTIVDLLIGLNRPDRGHIFVDGTPLDEIDLFAWRKMIGYVPQELNLFHTNVRDNITLNDASITDQDVHAALAQAGAAEFIASLPQGLDTDVGEMGSKFSGGQRQRISLARALVTKPKVLILDEVTSALDPATEAEIVENIATLRGSYTIIAITHRPAWTSIADRLYRVSHGKVTPEMPRGGGRKSALKVLRK